MLFIKVFTFELLYLLFIHSNKGKPLKCLISSEIRFISAKLIRLYCIVCKKVDIIFFFFRCVSVPVRNVQRPDLRWRYFSFQSVVWLYSSKIWQVWAHTHTHTHTQYFPWAVVKVILVEWVVSLKWCNYASSIYYFCISTDSKCSQHIALHQTE